jgi:dihydrofolate synthase/folylpolyglutamate synthase
VRESKRMISYDAAVEALYALGHELHAPRKFDLAHMRALCRALGNPQRRFRSVLIAGTNGKGSTAATLASILLASGHRTGLYTSPHLVRVNERIRVNGDPIPDADFASAYARVTEVAAALVAASELPHPPSFFETVTAIAFEHFASSGAEIAVLEAGMGGRLDATNVVEPILSVITDIDLDHQKFLGNTIAAIATEKAGILRPGVAAVTLPQHPEANQTIGERMLAVGARAVNAARNLPPMTPAAEELARLQAGVRAGSPLETRFPLSVLGCEVEIVSPLVGRHQLRNLALAITAAEELAGQGPGITPQTIARGTRQTRWPGRLERLAPTGARPEVLLDVAHNPAGAWALRSALSELFDGRPMVLLFASMADKAIASMAQILWPQMEHVVLTQVADSPRAASVAVLAELAQSLGVKHSLAASVPEGVAMAIARSRELGAEALVVIAGSIYLAGEALPLLR